MWESAIEQSQGRVPITFKARQKNGANRVDWHQNVFGRLQPEFDHVLDLTNLAQRQGQNTHVPDASKHPQLVDARVDSIEFGLEVKRFGGHFDDVSIGGPNFEAGRKIFAPVQIIESLCKLIQVFVHLFLAPVNLSINFDNQNLSKHTRLVNKNFENF